MDRFFGVHVHVYDRESAYRYENSTRSLVLIELSAVAKAVMKLEPLERQIGHEGLEANF